MSVVRYESADRVARIVMDDVRRRNALGSALVSELTAALARAAAEPTVRAVILEAEGPDFCAGGDIATFDLGVVAGRDYVYETVGVFRMIEHMRCPVIAAVRGRALGGGFELALACDLIVASTTAQFALPEVGVGAIPAFALLRLSEVVSRATAKSLAWSSRRVDAQEASTLGFVDRVVEDAELDAAAHDTARRLAALPRVGAELVKAAVNREIADRALFESTTAAAVMWGTQAMAAGRQAFFDKRPPDFPDE